MMDTRPFGRRYLAVYHTHVTMMDIMNDNDDGVEEQKRKHACECTNENLELLYYIVLKSVPILEI